ncbi:MAG: hypothetical protein WD845_17210 [Pirellulales bacterium]
MQMHVSRLFIGLVAVGSLLAAGCGKSEQIERYTVAKPEPIKLSADPAAAAEQPPGEPTDRTLAAIVPHGEQGWFFKITGPKDAVAAQSDAFTTFVKSLRFTPEGKPEWTVPAGWQEQPGGSIRYATLVIPSGDKPLELSVTALPKPPGDDENYALVNINRWRGQLKLPPIEPAQLSAESTSVELDGGSATLVDLLGTAAPNAMGRPPFFPGAGNGN